MENIYPWIYTFEMEENATLTAFGNLKPKTLKQVELQNYIFYQKKTPSNLQIEAKQYKIDIFKWEEM